jgi:hypothetical protein
VRIASIEPIENYKLNVVSEDGKAGVFDVEPYLKSEAFQKLKDMVHFQKVRNGKYYIEWECGADLSADTIELEWDAT